MPIRNKRRANGEGSCSPLKNEKGKIIGYEVRLAQKTIDGKISRPKRIVKSRRMVAAAIQEMQAERDARLHDRGGRQLLKNYYLNEWVPAHVHEWAPRTTASYKEVFRLYIEPDLGNTRLDELTVGQVEKWRNKLYERVSSATAQNAYNRLRAAMQRAYEKDYVPRNVVAKVKRPTTQRSKGKVWTYEEIHRFLDVIRGHRLEALYTLALRLGLREGELIGLLWEDLDFTRKTLRVTGQIQKIDGKIVRLPPKKQSYRTIRLPDDLIELLYEHRHKWLEEVTLLGVTSDYVFLNEEGKLLDKDNLLRQLGRLQKQANLPKRRFHDLRHTAGSLMISAGADIVQVSKVLGHGSPAVTAKVYVHMFEEDLLPTVERVKDLLRSKR